MSEKVKSNLVNLVTCLIQSIYFCIIFSIMTMLKVHDVVKHALTKGIDN